MWDGLHICILEILICKMVKFDTKKVLIVYKVLVLRIDEKCTCNGVSPQSLVVFDDSGILRS